MGWAGSMSCWRNSHPEAAVDEITRRGPSGAWRWPTDDLALKGEMRFTALQRES
jgi:hypothetical protein